MKTQLDANINFITKIFSIIGFLMIFMPQIPDVVKNSVLGFAIVLLTIALIHSFTNKSIIRRKAMMNFGKDIIRNSMNKVVLFGGDLSWTDDYINDIKEAIISGKVVEVYYPLEKAVILTGEAARLFSERVGTLKKQGAQIYIIEKDIGLRCIITDPDTYQKPDDMKIIVAKRVYTHKTDSNKNKYRTIKCKYRNDEQRDICISYISNYNLVKNIAVVH